MFYREKLNVEECRHVSDRSPVFVRSFTLRPDPIGARDTDELKIAGRYIAMAACNTLNETRFIIDLDETALASLWLAACYARVCNVYMCMCVADNSIAGLRFVP